MKIILDEETMSRLERFALDYCKDFPTELLVSERLDCLRAVPLLIAEIRRLRKLLPESGKKE